MKTNLKNSLLLKLPAITFFLLLTISSLIWFSYNIFHLLISVINHSDIIVFEKGATYMLGCGLGLGLLSFFMIYEMLLKKKITTALNKLATRLAIAFLAIMVILPQVTSFLVHQYVDNLGYIYCPEQSYHWLHNQSFIFAADINTCASFER